MKNKFRSAPRSAPSRPSAPRSAPRPSVSRPAASRPSFMRSTGSSNPGFSQAPRQSWGNRYRNNRGGCGGMIAGLVFLILCILCIAVIAGGYYLVQQGLIAIPNIQF